MAMPPTPGLLSGPGVGRRMPAPPGESPAGEGG